MFSHIMLQQADICWCKYMFWGISLYQSIYTNWKCAKRSM